MFHALQGDQWLVNCMQLDSITYNELGDPNALASVEGRPDLKGLQSWQDQTQLGEKHFCHLLLEGESLVLGSR